MVKTLSVHGPATRGWLSLPMVSYDVWYIFKMENSTYTASAGAKAHRVT